MSVLRAVRRLIGRLVRPLGVRFFDVFYLEKDLRGELERIESPLALEVRPAVEADLAAIVARSEPEIAVRFDQAKAIGSICYVATHAGEIAGYTWLNRKFVDMGGLLVARLPAAGAYNYESLVFPEFRGRKIFQCMMGAVYADMKAAGCTFTANLVDTHNAASIAARRRYGVAFQSARFLGIPLLGAIPLGRRFVVGKVVRDEPPRG